MTREATTRCFPPHNSENPFVVFGKRMRNALPQSGQRLVVPGLGRLGLDGVGNGGARRTDSGSARLLMNSWMLRMAVVLSWLAGNVEAEDWPQWQGPRRDGTSVESGLNWSWAAAGP